MLLFRRPEDPELAVSAGRLDELIDAEGDLNARMMAIVTAYAPMGAAVYRIENTLVQPWVQGYVKNTFLGQSWRFVDVTAPTRPAKKYSG